MAKDASAADIKKAYRKLARANHPDSNPGDPAKHDRSRQVAEAYDVIGDPEKRTKYDEVRTAYASGGFGFPQGGFDRRDRLRRQRPVRRPRCPGRRRARRHVRRPVRLPAAATTTQPRVRSRGGDVETSATIGFTDALEGVTISLRLTSDAPCPDCSGTGGKPGTTAPHLHPSARAPASWSSRPAARSR